MASTTNPVIALAGIILCIAGMMSVLALFWVLPMGIFRGRAAAGCIALMNSLAMFGGFFGPYFMGFVKERTGSFSSGYFALAALFAISAVVWVVLRWISNPARAKLVAKGAQVSTVP
jgi:hypothetical protein